ncbi:hypothetical protein DY000_02041537 [Brassica cretica]|uniref:Uncharacterized protein n=1 Tax=Brassica cretica TaxID=69181 RepID=A0ABQ7B9U4_BRACR|nr:hypothetical protein DY000_02041537 [Brassica cretica]
MMNSRGFEFRLVLVKEYIRESLEDGQPKYQGLDVQNGQKWPLLSPSFELDDSTASFELEARKRAAAARALNWTTPELQDALSMGLLRGLELDETVISWRKEGHNEEMET